MIQLIIYVIICFLYGKIVNYHLKERISEMELEIKSLHEKRDLERERKDNEIELLNGTIKLMGGKGEV